MEKEYKNYFDELAKHLFNNFSTIQSIEKFTNNSAVIGAYAEKVILKFINSIVYPLRTSTGTIVGPQHFKRPKERPQLDAIIWDPNPLPAILDEDGFALVPQNSVVGVLEIKRSDSGNNLVKIEKSYEQMTKELFTIRRPFMGVICIKERYKTQGKNKLNNLVKTGKAVFLAEYIDNSVRINSEGLYELVNFLASLRKQHKEREKKYSIGYDT